MTSGDFLLAIVVLGFGLCAAYFRAEFIAYRRREREQQQNRMKRPWNPTPAR